jgi:hypothetical protein
MVGPACALTTARVTLRRPRDAGNRLPRRTFRRTFCAASTAHEKRRRIVAVSWYFWILLLGAAICIAVGTHLADPDRRAPRGGGNAALVYILAFALLAAAVLTSPVLRSWILDRLGFDDSR